MCTRGGIRARHKLHEQLYVKCKYARGENNAREIKEEEVETSSSTPALGGEKRAPPVIESHIRHTPTLAQLSFYRNNIAHFKQNLQRRRAFCCEH